MRAGIDVGGTFTDVIGVDDAGRTTVHKTFTTPEDPTVGVMAGVQKLGGTVHVLVHGTTIGTNALLERKGGRTALPTPAGSPSVLELARAPGPAAALYDFTVDNP